MGLVCKSQDTIFISICEKKQIVTQRHYQFYIIGGKGKQATTFTFRAHLLCYNTPMTGV